MKKVLLTVAALGLGLALTASVAAAEMSFTAGGKYQAMGYFINNGGGAAGGGGVDVYGDDPENGKDTFWIHSFYLYPKLQVNDKVSMQGEFRFIDREVWGEVPNPVSNWFDRNGNAEMMRVYKLWMNYDSPAGMIQIGRMPAGQWGTQFLDSTYAAPRIKWSTPFLSDPFSLTLMIQKYAEDEAFEYDDSDEDKDAYYVGLGHKGDMGKTDIALWSVRDSYEGWHDAYWSNEIWVNGVYTFGAINFEGELNYKFGEAHNSSQPDDRADIGALAFYLNASTQIDSFTLGAMGFYMSGDDNTADGDDESMMGANGVGKDFNPFAILTGDYMGFANPDKSSLMQSAWGAGSFNNVMPGVVAVAVYGGMKANDNLSFNAALGTAWADEAPPGFDDQYGWEFDLGMSYKLLDNLTYAATLGWLNTGDFFMGQSDQDIDNVYVLVHSLTMTF